MNNILKVGLLYGLFGILPSLIFPLIDKSLMFKGAFTWGSLILGIVILVFAGRKYFRDEEVGMLSYGAAMKNLLLASLIGMLLSTVFGIARFSNDAETKALFMEHSISSSEGALRWTLDLAGVDKAEIEDAVDLAKEEIEKTADDAYPFSWSKLPINLISVIVMSLILALIAAIFVREKDSAHA